MDQGNVKSFEEIFREYYKPIYNYVYMQILHREEAEDLVSDIFIKAMNAYDSYDPAKASAKTWLFRIAKNHLIDHYRKQAAHPTYVTEDEVLEAIPSQRDDYAGIEDETNKTVYAVLSQLRPEERGILVMKYIWELKNPEIARELGINEKAVSERVRRALAKCGKIAKDMGLDDDP
ncbi:MAG: sigma-70 family RNA polymerase sigma factor [Acetatifactor sp.]|nr:sigma-70 family RNA polymerase sigma factor [Acetatifactor sp.]